MKSKRTENGVNVKLSEQEQAEMITAITSVLANNPKWITSNIGKAKLLAEMAEILAK